MDSASLGAFSGNETVKLFEYPEENDSVFAYQRLESHKDIRLLTIYPSSSGEPLSCHLAHHALGTAPGYEAISYVWGDSSFTHLIFCDGKSVAVTNSLYEVLCRLRQPHEPRIIWIDGVCIDQSNKVERGQQVQLMGDIYREADRVIIWFGADPEGLAPIVFDRCLRISEQDFHGFRLADRLELTGPMNRFAECSWFERTWVIQELVLAKTAWVIWGKCEISWNHIQTAIDAFTVANELPFIPVGKDIAKIETFADIKKRSASGSIEILRALRWTHGLHCTDVRDKIYALLGLFSESKHEPTARLANIIKADYSKSALWVYENFAINAASIGLAGDLLRSVRHMSALERWTQDSYPSWVPDWTRIPRNGRTYENFQTLFSHLGNHSMFSVHPRTKTLSCSSLHFASVLNVSEEVDISEALCRPIIDIWTEIIKPRLDDQATTEEDLNIDFSEAITEGTDIVSRRFYPETTLPRLSGFLRMLLEDIKEERDVQTMLESMRRSEDRFVNEGASPYLLGAPVAWHVFPDGQRMFVVETGHIGLGPAAMRFGDVIRFLPETPMPMVLRPQDEFYQLVGGCYVARLMDLDTDALLKLCRDKNMEEIEIR